LAHRPDHILPQPRPHQERTGEQEAQSALTKTGTPTREPTAAGGPPNQDPGNRAAQ